MGVYVQIRVGIFKPRETPFVRSFSLNHTQPPHTLPRGGQLLIALTKIAITKRQGSFKLSLKRTKLQLATITFAITISQLEIST